MGTEYKCTLGAIDGNRTRNPDLEGQCFTIKLLLHTAVSPAVTPFAFQGYGVSLANL